MRGYAGGAVGPLGGLRECLAETLIESVRTTGARQQEALRLGQLWGRRQSAQGKKTGDDPPHFGIGWNQAVGVQFAEGNIERTLIRRHLSQAVQWQINAFADADSGDPGKQEGITEQVVGSAQFLLQKSIVVEGERSRQIARLGREVLAPDEAMRNGIVLGGKVL